MRHVIAFGWYGGKFSHLKWLLPLLPSCQHYCEPFGGSAAVLLNRDPSPAEIPKQNTLQVPKMEEARFQTSPAVMGVSLLLRWVASGRGLLQEA